jgi:GAF domain-containing protein
VGRILFVEDSAHSTPVTPLPIAGGGVADTREPDATVTEVVQHLADIAKILLAPGTVDGTLQQIVLLAALAIENCDEAGLCGVGSAHGRTRPTSELIGKLDQLQTELHEGPCIDALGGQDSVYIHDLSEGSQWPSFGPLALQAGWRSVLAFRLFTGAETLGALQLYARLPGAFNPTDRAQGLIFAAHAGMAVSLAVTHETDRERTDNLVLALASREIIGQAQGILMERERITADQAFDLLRRASQHLNLKLRDVAQTLVDTGLVPGDDPATSSSARP